MAKQKPTCPIHTPKPKRTMAKQSRKKGKGEMEKMKMNQADWSKNHDPLFKVKGLERHRRLNNIDLMSPRVRLIGLN